MGNQRHQRGNLLRFFAKREDDSSECGQAGLLGEDAFDRQLAIERMRAERSGFSFTVIVFSIDFAGSMTDKERAARALISVLVDRTRYCDAKGWFGEQLAVILPYTSRERAICLVAPLDSLFHQRIAGEPRAITGTPRLSFAVYEYPNDELKKGDTNEFGAGGIASSGS